jgi:hypothetical protein
MKGKKFKEVITEGRVEVIHTVLYTYARRGDGEMIAKCGRTINNIAFDGRVIPNNCEQSTIAVSNLMRFKEI